MKLKDLIRELNDRPDAQRLEGLMHTLFVKHGMTYAEQAEFFQRCDPRIDAARFEELCQVADEVK